MLKTDNVARDWLPLISASLQKVHPTYWAQIQEKGWLPGPDRALNAFSLPLAKTRYILFGESPYPRAASATGYAFMDGAVEDLWSPTGLSKSVNRATSLRNLMKMLLALEGRLDFSDLSQSAISAADKSGLIQTLPQLQANLQQQGVLLLNTTLVFSGKDQVKADAKAWLPFLHQLLIELVKLSRIDIQLILLGAVAKTVVDAPAARQFTLAQMEHPYNLSFITNPVAHALFEPWQLLRDRAVDESKQVNPGSALAHHAGEHGVMEPGST